jgi:hypothetical protein
MTGEPVEDCSTNFRVRSPNHPTRIDVPDDRASLLARLRFPECLEPHDVGFVASLDDLRAWLDANGESAQKPRIGQPRTTKDARPNFTWADTVDVLQVAQEAAHLRTARRFSTPDALIVGTGLAAVVRHLVPNDRDWAPTLASMAERIGVVIVSEDLPFP